MLVSNAAFACAEKHGGADKRQPMAKGDAFAYKKNEVE